MFNRDEGSGRWPEARGTEELETSIAALAARIREVTDLVRAITPVVRELHALQEASAELRSINPTDLQAVAASAPALPEPARVDSLTVASPPTGLITALPSRTDQPATPSAARLTSGAVQVTIARLNGPLEPVRIRRGLATLAGVRDVALVERHQSRLTVALDTDQDPLRLPIAEALSMVFNQEVNGEWTSDGEYLAVIEGTAEPSGDT